MRRRGSRLFCASRGLHHSGPVHFLAFLISLPPTPHVATLKDVASKAGVSIATVSRVFNEPYKVRPDTMRQVREAIEALDFRPSRVARRLRVEEGRSHILGLVIPDIQNPFWADVARGVEDVAYAQGYALLLHNSDEDSERQRFCLETLVAESVDGVILPTVREQETEIAVLVREGIPVVLVDRRIESNRYDTVVSDNVQGAYEAVSLLIGLGHRRIGFVGGIPNVSSSRERRIGYERALAHHGVPFCEELVREGVRPKENGRHLTGELLRLADPPTAVFTNSNLLSVGAIAAIRECGLRIPDDIALVGYDELPWGLGEALSPPLTLVRQPSYEMGRRAAEMLMRRMAEPDRPAAICVLSPELAPGGSCGSPLPACPQNGASANGAPSVV